MGNEVAVIGDYDIRDRKLADATAQSTINSTDAIEMKTTDGNQVFIDKASFIKAVGQAFTASDPKTFTKLLGMNGDSPMGIGASDLASVLGESAGHSHGVYGTGVVRDFGYNVNIDFNAASNETGVNCWWTGSIQNSPSGNTMYHCLSFECAYHKAQIAICPETNAMYYRTKAYNKEWSSWMQVTATAVQ